ncbi:peptidylprolyl isomerase [uncultured Maribacter sp.]|uniref:peptidylprolyl isomerase n=1 Tax=uncultured Maribacter sp. TaxID=431308 RepID=UPI002610E396|nr:peptidylprolyl isomerase [uncultured Maribacter sp.]
MFVLKKKSRLISSLCLLVIFLLVFISCGSYLKKEVDEKPLARVGQSYLYMEAVAPFLTKGISSSDSAAIITNYINNWASKQLLLSKAKINLSEEKLAQFDTLVANYRTDLYTRAYKEALVQQGSDSIVTDAQLRSFYEREKDNFKLKERILRLRFVEIPNQFLNKNEVVKRLKNFKNDDIKFLDSISVQFRKLNFNDSIWVSASRVIEEIPPLTIENQDRYLKKSQFFELKDSLGVYLGKIVEVKEENTIAPLSFIKPSIRQVLLSRRKLDYVRKLEAEIIDEAIKEKEFEVYVPEE